MRKIIVIGFVIILLLPFVLPFALKTGVEKIYFEPGLKKTVPFLIDNYDGPTRQFKLEPVSKSEALSEILDEVVYLRETEALIKEGESHVFNVDLTLPDSLPYGTHEMKIFVFGDDPATGGTIKIRKILAFRIIIYSLYPGKYLEGNLLKPSPANIGEILYFTTTVRNLGTEDIENARTKVDIYTEDNPVGSVYSDYAPIASKETKEINANLLVTEDYNIGEYVAKASIEYDGQTEDAGDSKFNIGELSISILNITSKKFENNKINKFDIEVESKWNGPIDVYADIIITNLSGIEITKFKTQIISVEGWKQEIVPVYFDAKNIENGNYMLKVILNYEEKTSQRTFIVYVGDIGEAEIVKEMPGMPKQSVIIILLSVVIVLLIIIIALMLFSKRKKVTYNEIQ